MRGRKKKELTKEELIIRGKSQKRISDFIEDAQSSGLSRPKLANKLGISEGSLRNYQAGRNYISLSTATDFEKLTGVSCQYWLGLIDEHITVAEQKEETAMYDPDELNAKDDSIHLLKSEAQSLSIFFSKCGFSYENLSLKPTYEFWGVLHPQETFLPHKITSLRDPSIAAQLSDDDLHNILGRAHDLIELECFKLK